MPNIQPIDSNRVKPNAENANHWFTQCQLSVFIHYPQGTVSRTLRSLIDKGSVLTKTVRTTGTKRPCTMHRLSVFEECPMEVEHRRLETTTKILVAIKDDEYTPAVDDLENLNHTATKLLNMVHNSN